MQTPEKKSFWALIVTQFFSAFNDNLLKTLVQLLIVNWVVSAHRRNQLTDLSGVIFVAPFLLFSMTAGRLSDRLPKPKVIVGVQVWQLLVVAVATVSLLKASISAMMLSLFLLSMQAAFFSPAKYGILPELMHENELSSANGILNMGTFVAILVGTIIGTFFSEELKVACGLLIGASIISLLASLQMEHLPPARPDDLSDSHAVRLTVLMASIVALGWLVMQGHHHHHARTMARHIEMGLLSAIIAYLACLENVPSLIENWKIIRQDRSLKLGVIAVNYFWFVGAILQISVFLYAREMMGGVTVSGAFLHHLEHFMGHTAFISGILLVTVTIGIGLGSYLAGVLSGEKVETGLVPLGALGMSVFAIALGFTYHSLWKTMIDLFLLGLAGGFYEVPLNALVQWRSPARDRGRVLATQNFLSFLAILCASGALLLLGSSWLNLNPAQMFLVLGVLSLIGTIVVYSFLPAAVWRFILYGLTSLFYRIRIIGSDYVPARGPALLVSNHLSLADGFLIGAAVTRPVRFLVWKPYYEDPRFHWLMKAMKAIPISDSDAPHDIVRSLAAAREALQAGDLVCIFAEGEISRTGNLLEFKKGFEHIIKDLDAPVIPVNLDRVWGSIFSFEHGHVIFKWPRRIPYPVTVTFGEPTRGAVSATAVRQAVMDLGSETFGHRLEEKVPLPLQFLRDAKKHSFARAVADSMGRKLSYGMLAATSGVLAKHLDGLLNSLGKGAAPAVASEAGECVGILLPPSVAAALANLAVGFSGRVPVNLNYTAGAERIAQAVQKASIARVITTRKLLEKMGLGASPEMIYIEDLVSELSKREIIKERALFSLLPIHAASARLAPKATTSLGDAATILFSSGSTGIPKGVVLTHANILSNCLALAQVFDVGRSDCILGVLPFFHALGLTATFWFPLLTGFSTVYHSNPLDVKVVGELCEKYHATLLLATPTFLSAYLRKCTYKQFRFLRFVITGAERLRRSVAEAFEEKFDKKPLEGYGCTELSPVAAVNVPNVSMGEIRQIGNRPGTIGQPLPGVSVKIVHPETFEPVAQGNPGLLLVKGPNVMKGYLGEPEKTAEVMRDGWYVTGDIAVIDKEGFIQLQDRLSRFSKIGGEMVPHLLIEEKLNHLAGAPELVFAVTTLADEKRGEKLAVLYLASARIDLDALYKKLQDSDLPKLWIPAKEDFHAIESFPYLGTGKIDLAALKEIAKKASQR